MQSAAKQADEITMDCRVGGDDITAVQRPVARGKIGDEATSLADQNDAGGDIP